MNYSIDKVPDIIKMLSKTAQKIWITAFNSAYKEYDKDEETCNKVAWSAVKKAGYKKNKNGKWSKSMSESENPNIFHLRNIFLSDFNFDETNNDEKFIVSQVQLAKEFNFSERNGEVTNQDITSDYHNELNNQFFDIIVKNFERSYYGTENTVGLMFDLEHMSYSGAVGWIKKVYKKLNDINKRYELWAEVEWNKRGIECIKNKEYIFTSVAYCVDKIYKSKEDYYYEYYLCGAALTNRPYVTGMAPVNCNNESFEEWKYFESLNNINGDILEENKLSDKNMTNNDKNEMNEDILAKDKKIKELSDALENSKKELDSLNLKIKETNDLSVTKLNEKEIELSNKLDEKNSEVSKLNNRLTSLEQLNVKLMEEYQLNKKKVLESEVNQFVDSISDKIKPDQIDKLKDVMLTSKMIDENMFNGEIKDIKLYDKISNIFKSIETNKLDMTVENGHSFSDTNKIETLNVKDISFKMDEDFVNVNEKVNVLSKEKGIPWMEAYFMLIDSTN